MNLAIITVGRNNSLHRHEVPVFDRLTIRGVPCFVHHEKDEYVVSSVECGGRISEGVTKEVAVQEAVEKLSDKAYFHEKMKHVRALILDSGHLYPVNAIELFETTQS